MSLNQRLLAQGTPPGGVPPWRRKLRRAQTRAFGNIQPGPVGPQTLSAVVSRGEVADQPSSLVVDLGGIPSDQPTLQLRSRRDPAQNRSKRLVKPAVRLFAESEQIDRSAGMCRRIRQVFVEGARQTGCKAQGSLANGQVVDMLSKRQRKHQGLHSSGLRLTSQRLADLLDGRIFQVDGPVTNLFERTTKPDRRILQVQVHHLDVALRRARHILSQPLDEDLILAQPHGRDIGQPIVLMHQLRIRKRSLQAAREHVENGDGVARLQPACDRKREREGCIAAMRRENEDLQVAYFTGIWSRVWAQLATRLSTTTCPTR